MRKKIIKISIFLISMFLFVDLVSISDDIITTYNADIYKEELDKTVKSIEKVMIDSGNNCLKLGLFSDLHHDYEREYDTMEDMYYCLNEIHKKIKLNTIYSLGDNIDGQMNSKNEALNYQNDVINRFGKIVNTISLVGNHDNNCQSTWSWLGGYTIDNIITTEELANVLYKKENKVIINEKTNDFYVDYTDYNIRVIGLSAFSDVVNEVYYRSETVNWLDDFALQTNYSILVLSHFSTRSEWSYQSDVKNGNIIENELNDFAKKGGEIIAFVHGHIHADMVKEDNKISWKNISIGCSKFEQIIPSDLFPMDIKVPSRSTNDYTKLLFDILCIDIKNRKIHFLRFGAGDDFEIEY